MRDAFDPEFRQQRFARSPVIEDGYAWFLQQKAEMIAAALWYAQLAKVHGDYLEFGVYEGMTFVQAWHTAQQLSLPMHFHAFDSFEGLPPVDDEADADGPHREGMARANREGFEQNLTQNEVDRSRVTVTQGMFDQTLTPALREQIGLESAAVVWVDCDLYTSTVTALDFVTEVLADGAVVIFDDWFAYRSHPDRGEQRAFEEWLAANPQFRATEFRELGFLGQSFVVRRVRS